MRFCALVLTALLFLETGTSAAILSQYNFTGGAATSSDTDALSTSGNFNLSATGSSISTSSDTLFLRSNATASANLTQSITNGTYVGFTITPTPGTEMNLTSLTFAYGASNSTSGDPAFTTNMSVLSSIGGFTTSSTTLGNYTKTVNGGSASAGEFDNLTINLSALGSAYSALTTPVEFRFYYHDTVDLNNAIHRLDTVVLNGTVAAVPEPGFMLVGLAALGVFGAFGVRRGQQS